MADGWGGDPGHSGAKPMAHLQGGMAEAHTQAPMMGENSGPARGDAGATTGDIAGWNTTSLNPAHPTNGGSGLYKTPGEQNRA